MLVQMSEESVAILTPRDNTPEPGARIRWSLGRRRWSHPADVIRIDPLSPTLNLAVAVYAEADSRPEPERRKKHISHAPDRRGSHRVSLDRRRSARWSTDTPIRWRSDDASRAPQLGRVVERSLDGFAMTAHAAETPPAGARIQPCPQAHTPQACGFRSARVVRTESVSAERIVVFAEIEA
jgi:hypothetical protein